jgi:hypothetical protein
MKTNTKRNILLEEKMTRKWLQHWIKKLFTPIRKKVIQMPKKVENKLKRQAKKKGLKGKRANAYVYGTMQKLGLLNK